jgi:hypothetical protein
MTGRDVAFWKPHRSAELAGRDIDQPLLAAGAIALLTTSRMPRKAWLQLRVTCLLTSFNILVGIGVNEMILRVDLLHASAPIVGSPAVELTHFVVLLLFLRPSAISMSACCGNREKCGGSRRANLPDALSSSRPLRRLNIELKINVVSLSANRNAAQN